MWMVDAHESSSSKDDWVRIRTAFLPYILRSFAERAKNFWPARRMPVARTSSGLLKALTTFCCSSVESYDHVDSEKGEKAGVYKATCQRGGISKGCLRFRG